MVASRYNQIVNQRNGNLATNIARNTGFEPTWNIWQDVMVINPSYLYGIPEDPDIIEDMRLGIDNMSYEELPELEEQIGDVCTGLREETILANLTRRKHESITTEPLVETEPCCICQDYADGEELGKLDCGHEFHFNCIKEWLVRKNS
ncbi:Detected protein of unknown function [Hibiscus syriacus]|uniref:RING-type E3 ubiquitin transferase n=1 Tax=Hibiscus syriacus TaxID=106335 RepID=A0A6A3D4P9_HIBSY|nr:Detected protein of unknown function [Hibiscus syriacus]